MAQSQSVTKNGLEPHEPPITPEDFQQALQRLSLRMICLDAMRAQCDREAFAGKEISVFLHIETNEQVDREAIPYNLFIEYRLSGKCEEKEVLKIDARYRLIFDTETPVPSGFFDVFEEVSLRMMTMPYYRDLVSSMTSRMEMPTLTLPMNIISPPNTDDVQTGENDTNIKQ